MFQWETEVSCPQLAACPPPHLEGGGGQDRLAIHTWAVCAADVDLGPSCLEEQLVGQLTHHPPPHPPNCVRHCKGDDPTCSIPCKFISPLYCTGGGCVSVGVFFHFNWNKQPLHALHSPEVCDNLAPPYGE